MSYQANILLANETRQEYHPCEMSHICNYSFNVFIAEGARNDLIEVFFRNHDCDKQGYLFSSENYCKTCFNMILLHGKKELKV